MKNALVIYDSLYGNTEKVAQAVAKSLKNSKLLHLAKVKNSDIKKYKILIIGSPTQGGRCTSDMEYFLENTKELKNKKTAVFDTRFNFDDLNFILKILIKKLNYAANMMQQILKGVGAEVIAEPLGVFVSGKEGPLKEGEVNKAIKWARSISIKN